LTLQQPTTTIDEVVEQGLDFLLSHFNKDRLFPRTIQTDRSEGKQIEISSKIQVLNYFKDSNYIDCRINAFPINTRYKDIQRYPPDIIFIDIDRSTFSSDRSFEKALKITLKNIKDKFEPGEPTVNHSGNGYHIVQPLECPILETLPLFEKYKDILSLNISEQFLRFAEISLSNGKADPGHYPSFKSCHIRVPNTINKKCLENREKRLSGCKVRTIQKWNGIRARISREFIEDFRTYLEVKVSELELEENELSFSNNHNKQNQIKYDNDSIEWIDKLIQIPTDEYRKRAIDLIFVPYFVLVKKLANEETIQKITEWLDKCNSIRNIDFNAEYKINYQIKYTNKTQIPPMKKTTLKEKYQYLYLILKNKGILN
jgi:hypothetical protein